MNPWKSVFAIAPACHASVGHYTSLWQNHFYEGIRGVVPVFGAPVGVDFDWAFTKTKTDRPSKRSDLAGQLRRQILDFRDKKGLDAIISYARSVEIDPDLVRETTASGIPWINFFCDSISDFASVRKLAEVASLNWFPENNARAAYQEMGPPIFCRPYAYNERFLPELPSRQKRFALGFVGMPTQNRVAILGALAVLGHPPEIHGHGWKSSSSESAELDHARWQKFLSPRKILSAVTRRLALRRLRGHIGAPLTDAEFMEFLAECKIVLGLNDAENSRGRPESYLKFRDLEMPGLGCCYLTQDNIDIRQSLIPDREVLLFRGLLDARDKIRFYSKNPEGAARIASAARSKVLQEHTWRTRLREIQHAVGASQSP